jgi:hypothetical protein
MSKSKSGSNIKAICLYANKTVREFKITPSMDVDQIDYNKLSKSIIKTPGEGSPSREADFNWSGDTLSVYCWGGGKAGSENQHDLPPPIDTNLYFGDIIIIRHCKGVLKNISKENYESFYEAAFGGFENLGSEDSWSSEEEVSENDSIHDFIVSDSEDVDANCNSDESDDEDEAESSSESEDDTSLDLSTDSGETVIHIPKKKDEVGSSEANPDEVGSSEANPDEVGSSEANPGEVGSSEANPDEVGSSEANPDKANI